MPAVEALMEKAAKKVTDYAKSSGKFQEACDSVFAQLDWQGTGKVRTNDAVAATGEREGAPWLAAWQRARPHARVGGCRIRRYFAPTCRLYNYRRCSGACMHACMRPHASACMPPPNCRPPLHPPPKLKTQTRIRIPGVFFEQLGESLKEYGLEVQQPAEAEVREVIRDTGLIGRESLSREQFEALYLGVLKLAAGKCLSGFAKKYGMGMAVGTVGLFIGKRVIRGVPIVGLLASPFLMLLPTLIAGPVLGTFLAAPLGGSIWSCRCGVAAGVGRSGCCRLSLRDRIASSPPPPTPHPLIPPPSTPTPHPRRRRRLLHGPRRRGRGQGRHQQGPRQGRRRLHRRVKGERGGVPVLLSPLEVEG
jgi:hypothetical protein